jgi:hypothetical protein
MATKTRIVKKIFMRASAVLAFSVAPWAAVDQSARAQLSGVFKKRTGKEFVAISPPQTGGFKLEW